MLQLHRKDPKYETSINEIVNNLTQLLGSQSLDLSVGGFAKILD